MSKENTNREEFPGFEVGMMVEITRDQKDYFATNPADLVYKKGTRGRIETVNSFAVFIRTDKGELIPISNPEHLKTVNEE